MRRSIRKLEPPAMYCQQLVYEELLKIAEAACPGELGRFPVLQRRLAAAVLEFIQVGLRAFRIQGCKFRVPLILLIPKSP